MLTFKELVHQREALDVAIKEALTLESATAKAEAKELGLVYCIKRESQTKAMQKLPVPQGFFEQKAGEALEAQGLRLGEAPTRLETQLIARLLLVCGAAMDVLDDVENDGMAEANDMAVLRLRKALAGQRLS